MAGKRDGPGQWRPASKGADQPAVLRHACSMDFSRMDAGSSHSQMSSCDDRPVGQVLTAVEPPRATNDVAGT